MGFYRGNLTQEAYDREYPNNEILKRIWSYFRPWMGRLIWIAIWVTVLSIFGVLLPIVVASGVGLIASDRQNTTVIAIVLVAIVLVLGILTWAVNWIRRVQTGTLIADVILAMRKDTFSAVMGHDLSFFDKYQSGRIVSRVTSDTDEFGRTAVLVTDLITQLLLVAMLLVYLIRIDWKLTIILCVLAPVGFLIAGRFQNWARRITRHSQQAIADVNVSIQEAVTGISVAKNFRREQRIYDEFLDVNGRSYTIMARRGVILSSLFPTLTLFSGIGSALLLYFGGASVYAQVINAGAWF